MITPRDVAYVACRILAFSLLILNIGQFFAQLTLIATQIWAEFNLVLDSSAWLVIGLSVLMLASYLGLIWLVWSNARWISRKIIPEERNTAFWPRVRLQDLQVAAFSVVGVYFFVSGAQTMTSVTANITRVMRFLNPNETVQDWLLSGDSLYAVAGIVFGLVLMVGSRGIVRAINGLRATTQPADDALDTDRDPLQIK